MIKFYNTMGRRLEVFEPLEDRKVRMYTCGPTVWNYPHIGNYRTFLFEDMLRRYLKFRGYTVVQVMNLTDVDDRIIKECNEQNISLRDLTSKYEAAFFEDLDYLGFDRAELYPRATRHIREMVAIIEGLLEKNVAYKSQDGSIYFDIRKFPEYGKLSGLKLDELKAGARVKQDDYDKGFAQDFALWKAWDENDGQVFWETSVGKGRPGWHIECSAMSMKYLGESFDIHTGGQDNIFPHHENEIAQSESFTGKRLARYWLHSGLLLVNGEKMAKRLGNFITINDLKSKGADGRTVRLALLSGKYNEQLNFTDQSIDQAARSIQRIQEFVTRLLEILRDGSKGNPANEKTLTIVKQARDAFLDAMDNNLDSPTALAAIFDLVSEGNRLLDLGQIGAKDAQEIVEFIRDDFNQIFGVLRQEAFEPPELDPQMKELLDQREIARRIKDWAKADSLRTELSEKGIDVQDTPDGQKWRRKIKQIKTG